MNSEESIELIRCRIIDEYRKHPDLDWAEIAARKLHSEWLEYFNKEKEQTALEFTKWKDKKYNQGVNEMSHLYLRKSIYMTGNILKEKGQTIEQLFNEWKNLNNK